MAEQWREWLRGPLAAYKTRRLREGELWWSCLDLRRVLVDFVSALERIPELERDLAEAREATAWRTGWRDAALDRAERVEAAARTLDRQARELLSSIPTWGPESAVACDESVAVAALGVALAEVRAALATAPADAELVEQEGGEERLAELKARYRPAAPAEEGRDG